MARNYNEGVLVSVPLASPANFSYGFNSRLNDSLFDNFGQTVLTQASATLTGLIIGANAPKPPRATRKTANGYDGSYCSYLNIGTLRENGYRITRGKPTRGAGSSTLSKTVYITVNGIKYAWNSAISTNLTDAELGTLGVTIATGNEEDLIFGANFPKPPKAKKTTEDGSSVETFVDPTNADNLPTGWRLDRKKAFYTQEQLNEILPAS